MWLYGWTIFLSAFLLFQVELIIAKYLLPWFGGVPALWTTCLVFFQVSLTVGYVYAHGVATRLDGRMQRGVHLGVLLGAVALLAWQAIRWPAPILPQTGWRPIPGTNPVPAVLMVLGVSVGLPFLALAPTSSLAQAWAARTWKDRSPYRLYAVSNAGSLLGLLSYPFLVEPVLPLRMQARVWTGLFLLFAAGCSVCAWRAAAMGEAKNEERPERGEEPARPGWKSHLLWLILAACPSALLMATTNLISEEVTVVPFLWVLPLSIYLISFILCFQGPYWYQRELFVIGGVVAILLVLSVLLRWVHGLGFSWICGSYGFALYVCCMICHGELARLKPNPRHLTSFFFTVSLGGALGGVLAGVVAPLVFNFFWELYIAYFGCAAVLAWLMWKDRRSAFHGRWKRPVRIGAVVVLAGMAIAPYFLEMYQVLESAHPVFQALHKALGLKWVRVRPECRIVALRRGFYGRIRVQDWMVPDPDYRKREMCHGRTIHGIQYLAESKRHWLTSYFAPESGLGLAIANRRAYAETNGLGGIRIGVLGLGAGTIAAYGLEGDSIRFYEINPDVVELAAGTNALFRFVGDSLADVEIAPGDGRISLESEPSQQFDVLAVDAFNGDSPPMHLLTKEACELYLRHMKPGGIIALHISNRYLKFDPVIWSISDELGLTCFRIWSSPADKKSFTPSKWMLLTADRSLAADPILRRAATPRKRTGASESIRAWTDDRSNLLQLLL